MSLTDWIGFMGVTLLLVAFFLNLKGTIEKENLLYILLNIVGAFLACLASVLLHYLPFIILEGCWTLVSLYGLTRYFRGRRHLMK
ncbi:MAG: hypothetical protein MUO53_11210 [Maribacter sp.]|nr:hypothetical protein [Maribacter sp.]